MNEGDDVMNVCVFCGASPLVRDEFRQLATATGELIAQRSWRLVFGGGAHGMMGAVASGALQAGGQVLGVLPRFLFDREPPHPGVADIQVVDTMHERKARMYEASDAFLTLPGGFGTLDETLEIITWRQLALHDKPVVFVGGEAFWGGLEQTFDVMYANGFLSDRDRRLVRFENSAEAAVASLTSGT
jgi:uncharacterized protein (TIGR00730 family)